MEPEHKQLYDSQYSEGIRPLPDKYLHEINTRLKIQPTDRILELGTNQGALLKWLKGKANTAFGIDINEAALRKAQEANLATADALKLPFADKSFDSSISVHLLEHLPDLSAVMHEIDRVTKDGGLSLHFFPRPWTAIRGLDGAMIDALKKTKNPIEALKMARKLHLHILNPKKILKYCQDTNLELVSGSSFYVASEGGLAWGVLLKKKSPINS